MFSISSTSSSRKLIFSGLNGEYFRVELTGDVSATTNVWAYTDANNLNGLFQELGRLEKPWQGEKGWQSIEGEFSIAASCSALGEVMFKIQIAGSEGAPEEWRVSAGLATEFGQLPQIAKSAEVFFV